MWIAVGAVVVLVGGLFILNKSQKSKAPEIIQEQIASDIVTPMAVTDNPRPSGLSATSGSATSGPMMEANTKTISIDARNFSFSVKEIRVKQGDKVKIVLTNKDGMHDWVIDEFKARTKIVKTGETDTVEFVVNKKGTFEYYCSIGQHRKNGMKGNLIVE